MSMFNGQVVRARTKVLSRHEIAVKCFLHRVVARVRRRTEALKLSRGINFRRILPPTIDTVLYHDHDSSIRTPISIGAIAPNQSFGLACADHGHPQAALDANDFCGGATFAAVLTFCSSCNIGSQTWRARSISVREPNGLVAPISFNL